MQTNQPLWLLLIILTLVCPYFYACAQDPRRAIERKYERKVEEARKNERKAIADGNYAWRLVYGLQLAEAEQALACTRMRTAHAKLETMGQKPSPLPSLCEGKGE